MATTTNKAAAKRQVDTAASGVTTPEDVWQETSVLLHEKSLYPTIRVKTDKATGSGTLIFTKDREEPDEDGELGFSTYAITNHHVVASAIRVEKEFDPQKGKYITRDYRDRVQVEVYAYKNRSTITSRTTAEAEIVAYSAKRDLAILKLLTNQKFPFIASLLPNEKSREVHVFDKIFVVGCGLGMQPFPTSGLVSAKDIEIDHYPYWMGSAPAIYGNSGGAVFLGRTLDMMGVVSRISVSGGMFGGSPITHMQYFCPPFEIHRFIKEQGLLFLTDPSRSEMADLRSLNERKEKGEGPKEDEE
jgi:S1-C subfamily serine protease